MPDKRSGPEGPPRSAAVASADGSIVADARDRLRRQRDHLAVCGELHRRGGDLARWYRQPKGAFYCRVTEGWWAA